MSQVDHYCAAMANALAKHMAPGAKSVGPVDEYEAHSSFEVTAPDNTTFIISVMRKDRDATEAPSAE